MGRITPHILYAAYVSVLCLVAFMRPMYNWDMAPYVGLVYMSEGSDSISVHHQTYHTINAYLPTTKKDAFETNPYERDMTINYRHFYQQLPYYAIKPLYVWILRSLYRTGINPIDGGLLVSAFSSFLLSILVFIWLQKYYRAASAALCSAIVVTGFGMINIAREFSPTALTALCTVGMVYFFFERQIAWPAVVLGVVSIYLRSDNLFFVAPIFGLYLLMNERRSLRVTVLFGMLILVLTVSVVVIMEHYGYPGWKVHFYHSFIQRVNAPLEFAADITVIDYLKALTQGVLQLPPDCVFSISILLALIAIKATSGSGLTPMRRIYVLLIASSFLSIASRFVLYPSSALRYYFSAYIVIATASLVLLAPITEELKLKFRHMFDHSKDVRAVEGSLSTERLVHSASESAPRARRTPSRHFSLLRR